MFECTGAADTGADVEESDVLIGFTRSVIRGPRNKIEEVKYTLTPHPLFVDEVIKANKRNNAILSKAEQIGIPPPNGPGYSEIGD